MKKDDEQVEPPSSPRPPVFLVGQDSRGNWVARDQGGTRGGLFIDRTQALRYIRSESINRSQDFIPVIGVFELDIGQRPATAPQRQFAVAAQRERRVA
jgi:hypothetical protein